VPKRPFHWEREIGLTGPKRAFSLAPKARKGPVLVSAGEPAVADDVRRGGSPQRAGPAHSSGSPALIRASRKPGSASTKAELCA
jgi:hypothetical protein